MKAKFKVLLDSWPDGSPIPPRYAFGQPGPDGRFAASENVSPAIRWTHPPAETRSFAIVCHDPDVPSSGEDVNQDGKTVPADLPRVRFYHWLLFDIPAQISGLDEGVAAVGITPRGKPPGWTEFGITGTNDYTNWFAGDPDMAGIYGGYDGPCPPWNDSIVHHYHFEVFALDVETLGLDGACTGDLLIAAMAGHVLAQASHVGTYTMNPPRVTPVQW